MIWLLLLLQATLPGTLTSYTRCYAEEMSLQRWEIAIEFVEDTVDVVAGTDADPTYLRAIVYYNLPKLVATDDSLLRRYVVHELFHIRSWELGLLAEETDYDTAAKYQEQLAEWVERLPYWQEVCR